MEKSTVDTNSPVVTGLAAKLSGVCLSVWDYFYNPTPPKKTDIIDNNILKKDLAAYPLILGEVSEERSQIINAVNNLPKAELNQSRLASGNDQKFFSDM